MLWSLFRSCLKLLSGIGAISNPEISLLLSSVLIESSWILIAYAVPLLSGLYFRLCRRIEFTIGGEGRVGVSVEYSPPKLRLVEMLIWLTCASPMWIIRFLRPLPCIRMMSGVFEFRGTSNIVLGVEWIYFYFGSFWFVIRDGVVLGLPILSFWFLVPIRTILSHLFSLRLVKRCKQWPGRRSLSGGFHHQLCLWFR